MNTYTPNTNTIFQKQNKITEERTHRLNSEIHKTAHLNNHQVNELASSCSWSPTNRHVFFFSHIIAVHTLKCKSLEQAIVLLKHIYSTSISSFFFLSSSSSSALKSLQQALKRKRERTKMRAIKQMSYNSVKTAQRSSTTVNIVVTNSEQDHKTINRIGMFI